MVELTVQVPNDTARRLEPIRDRLPYLLRQIAGTLPPTAPLVSLPRVSVPGATTFPVYDEVIDFLLTGPTPQQIISFKVSPVTQRRLGDLLEKNREGALTEVEEAELDTFEQIEHFIILLKARARTLD